LDRRYGRPNPATAGIFSKAQVAFTHVYRYKQGRKNDRQKILYRQKAYKY